MPPCSTFSVVLCATVKPLVNFDLLETKLPTLQNIGSWRIACCTTNVKRGPRNCDLLQYFFELQPLGLSHTFSIGSVSRITDLLHYAEERRKIMQSRVPSGNPFIHWKPLGSLKDNFGQKNSPTKCRYSVKE